MYRWRAATPAPPSATRAISNEATVPNTRMRAGTSAASRKATPSNATAMRWKIHSGHGSRPSWYWENKA